MVWDMRNEFTQELILMEFQQRCPVRMKQVPQLITQRGEVPKPTAADLEKKINVYASRIWHQARRRTRRTHSSLMRTVAKILQSFRARRLESCGTQPKSCKFFVLFHACTSLGMCLYLHGSHVRADLLEIFGKIGAL